MNNENVHKIDDGVELIDPHGGLEDLENGVLRHTSEAFVEDPLRILRVSRYAARFAVPPNENAHQPETGDDQFHQFAFSFEGGLRMEEGFRIAPETEDMMRRVAPELNRMSRDRIGMEIVKAMDQARRPSRFWEVLRESGALAVIFPELDRASIVPAGPPEHHAESSYMFED